MLQVSKYQKNIKKYPFLKNTVLIIKAVAGSGKSTTAVELAESLVKRKMVRASQQRIITFSNRSARDLQSKINAKFKGKKHKPQTSTLHGLMVKIIKEHFNPKITVLNQWQSVVMIRSIMIAKGFLNGLEDDTMRQKTKIAMEVYKLLDYVKVNVRVNGLDYYRANFKISDYKKSKVISDKKLQEVLLEYEATKTKTNMYDYSDLLFKAVLLLEANPDKLAKIRATTKMLSVDEVQDLALLDWTVVLLLSQGQRLMVVGDLDQTIYGFRYADPSKFNKEFLGKYFDNLAEFPLPINYRSTENIVRLGNIVRLTKDEKGLQGIAHRESVKGSVQLFKVANTIQEGIQTASIVQQMLDKGYKYKDITIISRTNAYLKQIVEPAMVKKQIPYKLAVKSAGKKLNERTSNLLYFNLIQLALNTDNVSATIDLAPYILGIGEALQQEISDTIINKGTIKGVQLNTTSATKVGAFRNLQGLIRELDKTNTIINRSNTIDDVLQDLHRLVLKYIKKGIVTEKEQLNIARTIAHYISYYQQETAITSLDEMLNQMLLELDNFDEAEDRNVVELATIHSQKGLSNKVYIACGFTSHRELKDEYQDEINILYVQLSRAEEELHIIYSDKYVDKKAKIKQGVINKQLRKVLQNLRNT